MFPEATEENCWVGSGPGVGTDKLTVVREQGLGDLREGKKRRRKRGRRGEGREKGEEGEEKERERDGEGGSGGREKGYWKVMIWARLGCTNNEE